jgi:methyl-accepting chemotaxis protein-4 (peptide sensor receptor)
LLTGAALLWSRKMIVQPLAIISSHFDSIAKGDLARPVAVFGKNEISAIFASLKAMQGSLRETVSDVRQGSYAMHTGISRLRRATTISRPAPSSRRPRWRRRQPAWSS